MFGWRIYKTVITDGNKFVNGEIVGLMDMITRRKVGRSRCRVVDRKRYPTRYVVRRFTNIKRYHDARREIEKFYPGVCCWDVTV